jgi:glycoprotein 6-alpha-L-fucosyltransferase
MDKPAFLPLSIPKEYEIALKKFHGDPFVWWAGQIVKYLMRFNSDFYKKVNTFKQNLKFQKPCVG